MHPYLGQSFFQRKQTRGFTLLEALLAFALLGACVALGMHAYRSWEAARAGSFTAQETLGVQRTLSSMAAHLENLATDVAHPTVPAQLQLTYINQSAVRLEGGLQSAGNLVYGMNEAGQLLENGTPILAGLVRFAVEAFWEPQMDAGMEAQAEELGIPTTVSAAVPVLSYANGNVSFNSANAGATDATSAHNIAALPTGLTVHVQVLSKRAQQLRSQGAPSSAYLPRSQWFSQRVQLAH